MTTTAARRLGWSLFALSASLTVASVAIEAITDQPDGVAFDASTTVFFQFAFLATTAVGALIASRHPGNPVGWLFCVMGLAFAVTTFTESYADARPVLPGWEYMGWVSEWTGLFIPGMVAFILLLFPDGALPSRRWRVVAWGNVLWMVPLFLSVAFTPGPLMEHPSVRNPFGIEPLAGPLEWVGVGWALYIVGVPAAAASLVVRFRRSRGTERVQLKWFALATAVFGIGTLASSFLYGTRYEEIAGLITGITALTFPVAAGIAMLKHRLYDVDVVISKTLVYTVLASFITAVYVAIVVGVGTLAGSRGPFLSAVAAAVVAIAFQPARRWAQRLANRLVYGKRATPYEVLSTFADRIAEAYSVDDVLPRMARILAEGTGAERVGIWLRVGKDLERAATWPEVQGSEVARVPLEGDQLPTFDDHALEVRHQGDLLGAVTLAMPANEPIDQARERLVAAVASQAGLILRNAALIAELRASRQRIVAAQDEERRRLERNIHDGAQQQLVALAVKLRFTDSLIGKDEERAHAMLTEIRDQTNDALEDLRDLARGIYPPLLADKGLAAAIEAQARKSPVPVAVEPNGIGRYPPEVEAAVYFCTLETLQNVAKYAEASRGVVRLAYQDGELTFEVTDDGRGFDQAKTVLGTGLQGMADRVAALGGSLDISSEPGRGTTVAGRIPAQSAGEAR